MGSLIDGYSLEGLFSNKENEKSESHNSNISENVLSISINSVLVNENQPRKNFKDDALSELATSIKEQGILQPIIVEEVGDNQYSIVAGERRYRAAKLANLEKVPVIVKKLTNLNRLEIALIENIQREDLNPIEEANAYNHLLNETGLTQEQLATKIGKSRSAISNSMRLLQLPSNIQEDIINEEYSSGHARAILSIKNPADRIILLDKIKKEDMSVRAAESYAKSLNEGKRSLIKEDTVKKAAPKDPEMVVLQDKFLQAVGNKVEIKGNITKGKIMLSYNSIEDLQELFHRLSNGGDLFEN
eukprot:Anaeramoba_ignava/a607726_18.p2 GENE.a607726_18~~a607726_18.p2  ORF type:complete len:302 (-),score=51.68 a607726_18:985-1890(-)